MKTIIVLALFVASSRGGYAKEDEFTSTVSIGQGEPRNGVFDEDAEKVSSKPTSDDYIMDTIKELREKLQEKLEILKTLAESAKTVGAQAKDVATEMIKALGEKIQDIIREIFGEKDITTIRHVTKAVVRDNE